MMGVVDEHYASKLRFVENWGASMFPLVELEIPGEMEICDGVDVDPIEYFLSVMAVA